MNTPITQHIKCYIKYDLHNVLYDIILFISYQ